METATQQQASESYLLLQCLVIGFDQYTSLGGDIKSHKKSDHLLFN